MTLILLFFNAINFYVQPVLYYSPLRLQDSLGFETIAEDIFFLEFNCAIPYNELYYKESDGKIFADCRLDVKIVNKEHTDSLTDSLFQQFTIGSFSQAAREGTTFYVQFGKYISVGEYEYTIIANSGDKTDTVQGTRSILEDDYLMSDILLAKAIFKDTTGGSLTKGNLRIIPNPSGIFEEGTKNLFVYYELSNINPDTTDLAICYTVSDTGQRIIRKITRTMEKRFSRQAVNLGFSIETFKPDDYVIKVVVYDSAMGRTIEKSVGFRIKKSREPIVLSEDLPYYDGIEYFVSAQEYKYFLTLKDEGRRMYLKKFWEKHDYGEISQRYEYADGHFQEGAKTGSKTDRGRVYIKYGFPDEIENKQFEESKPYEYWQYYNGLEFIFVDVRGTQEYTLVWTNARDEKSKPALFSYLPLFKRQELEEKKE
ncbi:MAG: GWxTD domain-containing protein [candidate division WOR-3 bacterium]